MNHDNVAGRLEAFRKRANEALDRQLPDDFVTPQALHRAMRYSVLNGGKRIRPLLTYSAGVALGIQPDKLDGAACAVELIHAYSLIHDDLPAMDDDDLRRGKATCHIEFGEALAILAGDALQALAFESIAADPELVEHPAQARDAVTLLCRACGSTGMAGGQAIDLGATGQALGFDDLKQMHGFKTGALIRCALALAACIAQASAEDTAALREFGNDIGLAFQIQDDILDIEGSTEKLGKPSGSDLAADKATFPACLGMTASRQMVTDLLGSALRHLIQLPGDTSLLQHLAHFIVERDQ